MYWKIIIQVIEIMKIQYISHFQLSLFFFFHEIKYHNQLIILVLQIPTKATKFLSKTFYVYQEPKHQMEKMSKEVLYFSISHIYFQN